MATLIIPTNTTFGAMTNQLTGRLISTASAMARLQEAISTASAGYDGVEGTEFEAPLPNINSFPVTNNFGVQPDPETPGKNGTDYRYAVDQLKQQWDAFWAAAQPYIAQLDNGVGIF